MLTHGIGNALSFNLFTVFGLLIIFLGFQVMKLGMSHFMNCSLYCLDLTHAVIDSNAIVLNVKIALCTRLDILKSDRHRTCCLDCFKECLISFHTSGKLIYTDGWKWFTFCLRDIKSTHRLKCSKIDFHLFLYSFAIFIKNDFAGLIKFFLFFFQLKRSRSKDTDSLLTLLYKASHLLPSGIGLNKRCIRLLHHDKDIVIHRVMRKLRHGIQ